MSVECDCTNRAAQVSKHAQTQANTVTCRKALTHTKVYEPEVIIPLVLIIPQHYVVAAQVKVGNMRIFMKSLQGLQVQQQDI